jgi:hypothetical protein
MDPMYLPLDEEQENIGTVITVEQTLRRSPFATLGAWRDMHPAHLCDFVYGAYAVWNDGVVGLNQGTMLRIRIGGQTHYYFWPLAGGDQNHSSSRAPMEAIYTDWDTGHARRQIHIPELYWFFPHYLGEASMVVDEATLRERITREMQARLEEHL